MELAWAAGLAPALSSLELTALATVLATLQSQVLAAHAHRPAGRLVIDVDQHVKHASTGERSRRFAFEKVVQLVAGLRLLTAAGDGELSSLGPFNGDVWASRDVARGDEGRFSIELTLAPGGAELLLGVSDPHLELVRALRQEREIAPAIGSFSPLVLWRSAWLEQTGLEQLLFLRLERAMQWESRGLQLGGIFGLPFDDLFRDLRLSAGRSVDLGPDLLRKLKVLSRIGKRLSAHGVLAPLVEDQYLAVGDQNAMMLMWQAGRERWREDVGQRFLLASQDFFLSQRYPTMIADLTRALLPRALVSRLLPSALLLWERVTMIERLPVMLALSPSQPLLAPALFFELALRQLPGSPVPLPESVAESPLAELTRGLISTEEVASSARVATAYERAQHLLAEDRTGFAAFAAEPLATVASQASRNHPHVQQWIHSAFDLEQASAHGSASDLGTLRPQLVAHSSVVQSGGAGRSASELPHDVKAKLASHEPRRSGATVSAALASRMLRTASDELHRIKSGDPERYASLKKAYLASLDEQGRAVMLDVQGRIQPVLFEEQLRQRLVRYMVDHPGAWRSAEAGKGGV